MFKAKYKKFCKLTLAFVILGFHVAVHAYDVETISDTVVQNDFVVGPAKIEISLNPGDSDTRFISVINRTGKDAKFFLGTEDFVGSRDEVRTVDLLGERHSKYSLKDFLYFPEKTFTLRHGEKVSVPVTIALPSDTAPGGKFGSVVVGMSPSESVTIENQSGANVVTRVAVLFFLKVRGDVNEEGVLKNFRVKNNKFFFFDSKIPLELLYENTGNVHLNPYGIVKIESLFGREVGTLVLDPWYVLPDSTRIREVVYEGRLLGYYRAIAEVNRGYADVVDEREISFLVVPPWVLILLALIFAAFIWQRMRTKRINA